ncbi:MAG: heme-copper oxidase subunit III family protein [Bdellovibrio sp.]
MSSHAAHSGPVLTPNDEQFGKATPGKIGMWLFLVTDAMSFAGLLLAYAVLRATQDWPNPIKALGGVGLSGFMTFLLICSSVSMVLSIDACKQKDRKGILLWLGITILGGLTFLGLQAYEYMHLMHDMGMTFSNYAHGNNLFSSTFFAITGFHGLHVLTGTLYLIGIFKMALDGRFDNGDYNLLEIAGLFWHFVDLVWILVFTFVYLL